MNDMRCPYKILIADGGKDPAIEENLRRQDNYPNLNYEYIRYPYDTGLDDFLKKLENVISRVQTPYLLQADNDDFFLLEKIPAVLAHLDEHPDCAGARGQIVNFEVFDKAGSSKGVSSGARYHAVSNEVPSLEMESDFERVEMLCRLMSRYDYYANWYCVFRSDRLQALWKELLTLSIKEMIVFEMLTLVLTANEGKIHVMPEPFYLRQNNTSAFGDTLVVGNEFLERCLTNNSLAKFSEGLERLRPAFSLDDKNRLLKAIAAWLEVFVSNIHQARLPSATSAMRWRKSVKAMPFVGTALKSWYLGSASLFGSRQQRKMLRFKSVEPYIIGGKEWDKVMP